MSIKELIAKYGYSVAITDDRHKPIVVVNKHCTVIEAKKIANDYFKCKWMALYGYSAWLKDDKVYFVKKFGAKPMWAISKTELD